MNYRFYNAKILSMDAEALDTIMEGEVHVGDERITYVGPDQGIGDKIGTIHWDRQIDCRGNLLMPGFKNAHTHSGMTLLRSMADDLPLSEWLNRQVFPIEAKMTPDDIYYLTKLAIFEYLTSGITAVFDMYLAPESIAEACSEMGMRCVQSGAVNDFGQSLKMMERFYRDLNRKDALNSFQIGFHAEYTCSEALLKQVAELAHQFKAPVFTHLAETESEVAGCRERHSQMTPAVYLDSLGLFEYGGGGFHCVHMTGEDMEVFQKRGLYAVTNPASNLKLASGIAPVASFLKRNIPVAIGTDGPASNNCLDMFREMFLTTGLAKVKEKDASAVNALEVLKMACSNGARCMGLTDAVSVTEGNLADLIMIDLQQPNMQPINHIAQNIVYSGSKQNVIMTMIHGRILYEQGEFHVHTDLPLLYEKVNEIAVRLKAEL